MNTEQKCLIWGTPAEVRTKDYGEEIMVNSPRAGGRYETRYDTSATISRMEPASKVKLTNRIVEQNRFDEILKITEETIDEVKSRPESSVFERADMLLRYLKEKSPRLGKDFSLFYPSNDQSNRPDKIKLTNELMAWTASEDLTEVITLLEYCHEEGWVELKREKIYVPEFMLRPPGYARLAELGGSNAESKQAFVAMWFGDSMKDAGKAIKKAIYESGYSPQLINEKEHVNDICDEIIAEIRRSRFIVADFTAGETETETDEDGKKIHIPRGGVYYEAGFAQGLNIPVIWTCHADQIGKIHFDTNHYNHITWENEKELYEKLKKRIGAVIGDGPIKPPTMDKR